MEIDRTLLSPAHQRPRHGQAERGQGARGRGAPRGDRGVAGHRQPAGGRLGVAGRPARGGAHCPGDQVTLICGGPAAAHDYEVVRSGGPYTQFLGAPFAYARRLRDCDVVVEVCNGMPFLAPLWSRKPMVCMVNHVHTDLWPLRFPPPLSTVGRFMEHRVMPWAHRRSLVLTVSASTALELVSLGVDRGRIRMLHNGVARPARRSRGLASRCSSRSAGSPNTSASTCCFGCGTGYARWSADSWSSRERVPSAVTWSRWPVPA